MHFLTQFHKKKKNYKLSTFLENLQQFFDKTRLIFNYVVIKLENIKSGFICSNLFLVNMMLLVS